VDASGGGEFTTIAAALEKLRPRIGNINDFGRRSPQDTIVVRPGTYKESLVITSDMQIIGEGGRAKVIVEGTSGETVVTFAGGNAKLTGMTIRVVGKGLADKACGAISVQDGTPVVDDCDLTSSAGCAVYIHGATSNPTIRNSTIRDSRDGGVSVYGQGLGTIELCLISGNMSSGVHIREGGNPTVRESELRDNRECGVYVYKQGQGMIEKCVISGNGLSGVETSDSANPTVRDCEIRDNKGSGIRVDKEGQGTFTGNAFQRNARGAWFFEASAGKVNRTGNRPNA